MTVPEVGGINWTIVRPRVDLPQPDSPTTPRTSPSFIDNRTPSTARTTPRQRLKINPVSTGKCVSKASTSRNGVDTGLVDFGLSLTADYSGTVPVGRAPDIRRNLLLSISPRE